MITIKRGSRGDSVRFAQERLIAHGWDVGAGDGVFGGKTDQAVRTFQDAHGLSPDGIVGDRTWELLEIERRANPTSSVLQEQRDWAKEILGMAIANGQAAPKYATGPHPVPLAAIYAAISDIGKREFPDGSNGGVDIDHIVSGYNKYHKIGQAAMPPWCCIAVSYWYGAAYGLGSTARHMDWSKHPFKTWQGSVYQLERWAKNEGLFSSRFAACPGAIFTMSRAGSGSDSSTSTRAGHTGLILALKEPGLVYTVEGNTGNRVACKVRKTSSLNGLIYPWLPPELRIKKLPPPTVVF